MFILILMAPSMFRFNESFQIGRYTEEGDFNILSIMLL